MPKVEFKRKTRLSRQEAADRLIALGNALSSGSEIELGAGEDTLKLGVAAHLNWELEIEIKWTDDPSNDAKPAAAQGTTDPAPAPAAVEPADDPTAAPEKPTPPRRGRPRKVVAT